MTVLKQGGEIPFGQCEIDGVRYYGNINDATISREDSLFTFPGYHAVNKCDHCGRCDLLPNTARSIEEAIELGYLVKVTGQ